MPPTIGEVSALIGRLRRVREAIERNAAVDSVVRLQLCEVDVALYALAVLRSATRAGRVLADGAPGDLSAERLEAMQACVEQCGAGDLVDAEVLQLLDEVERRRVEAVPRRNLTSEAVQVMPRSPELLQLLAEVERRRRGGVLQLYVAVLFGHVRPIGVYSTAALAAAALRAHPEYPRDPGLAKAGSCIAVHTLDGGPVMEWPF